MKWGQKGTALEIFVWGIIISLVAGVIVNIWFTPIGLIITVMLTIWCAYDYEKAVNAYNQKYNEMIDSHFPPIEEYMKAYGNLPERVKKEEEYAYYNLDREILNIIYNMPPEKRTPTGIRSKCIFVLGMNNIGLNCDSNGFYRTISEDGAGAAYDTYGKKYFPSGKRIFSDLAIDIYHAVDDE